MIYVGIIADQPELAEILTTIKDGLAKGMQHNNYLKQLSNENLQVNFILIKTSGEIYL
jgi:hypothetical protein